MSIPSLFSFSACYSRTQEYLIANMLSVDKNKVARVSLKTFAFLSLVFVGVYALHRFVISKLSTSQGNDILPKLESNPNLPPRNTSIQGSKPIQPKIASLTQKERIAIADENIAMLLRENAQAEVQIDHDEVKSVFLNRLSTGEKLRARTTRRHTDETLINLSQLQPRYLGQQTINVFNKDWSEVAADLVRDGFKPTVLNFPGQQEPAPGFKEATGRGLEESICNQTDYFALILDEVNKFYDDMCKKSLSPNLSSYESTSLYPIYDYALYTAGVTVFRKSEANRYALLENESRFKIDVFSIGAPEDSVNYGPKPPTKQVQGLGIQYRGYANEEQKMKMKKVLKAGLYAAYLKNLIEGEIDSDPRPQALVLGAYACGSYGHPAYDVATLFKELLDNDFCGLFQRIDFAILDHGKTDQQVDAGEGNKPDLGGNFQIFHDVLMSRNLSVSENIAAANPF